MDPEGPAAKGGFVGIGDVLFEVDETRLPIFSTFRPFMNFLPLLFIL
jgi:hypothetical protein